MKNLEEDKINALQSLKETQGWKLIVKILNDNIKDTEEQMFDEDIKDIQEMKVLQSKRNDRMSLKNLPDILIGMYQRKEGKDLSGLDPFA